MITNRKFTDEFLKTISENSKTLREFLTNIGSSTTSMSSRAWIKKRCRDANISLSHFTIPKASRNPSNKKNHISILTYDRLNGRREPSFRLRRILKELGVEEKCCKCNLTHLWNKLPIVLEIDHINGNPIDNRKDNLRFICPNCHSQVLIEYNNKKGNAAKTVD